MSFAEFSFAEFSFAFKLTQSDLTWAKFHSDCFSCEWHQNPFPQPCNLVKNQKLPFNQKCWGLNHWFMTNEPIWVILVHSGLSDSFHVVVSVFSIHLWVAWIELSSIEVIRVILVAWVIYGCLWSSWLYFHIGSHPSCQGPSCHDPGNLKRSITTHDDYMKTRLKTNLCFNYIKA